MGAEQLITENIGLWASAIKAKATQGRGSNKKRELYGIKKLRELILELAVRGKLVPQDLNDEPASVLLERIAAEKQQLVKQMMIKKPKKLAEIVAGELPFTLPTGWQWARLQDMTSYIQRGMGPQYDEFGTVRVVSQKCVQWSGFDLEASRHVANESLGKYQEERFLQTGDLLWNSTGTGTVGRIIELGEIPAKTLVADSHVTVVRPLEVLGGFLKAYISAPGIQSRFEPDHKSALVSGSTNQVELNTSAVETLEVPVPPKAEQHRIVAKVDELMALCDQVEQQTEISLDSHQRLVDALLESLVTAKAPSELSENWARLSEHFDTLITTDYAVEQLKQTILQLAVMGKLAPQDPTDEPASELLKCIAAEKEQLVRDKKIKKQNPLSVITDEEKPFELPKGWAISRLGDLLPEFQNGASSRGDKDGEDVVVIRLADISDWRISTADTRSLLIDEASISKYLIKKNDILIIRVNGSADIVGRFVFCEKDFDAIYCDHFIRMRFPVEVFNSEYLSLLAASSLIRKRIEDMFISTAGQKTVNQKHIASLLVTVPPFNEQRRIISKVNQLMSLCDQLKSSLSQARTTQLRLADAVVHDVIGEQIKSIEDSESNATAMKITTTLSLNHEDFDRDAIIATILLELGGSADAKDVWGKTKLSLPEFYAQLKLEIDAQYIRKPASADFKEA